MSNKNVAVVVSLVVVALGALAFVIFRSITGSEIDTKGLVPPPRASGPTFEPMPVTSKAMPSSDTATVRPTGKLKNITPPGDPQ